MTFHVESRGEGRARRWRAVCYVGKRDGGPRRICGKWRDKEGAAKADGGAILERIGGPESTSRHQMNITAPAILWYPGGPDAATMAA